MTHLPQQIAPLKFWDEFEDLCCALFQKEWQNPLAQKHGRRGQAQNGVDVFGQNKLDADKWYGVQCKGKDANYGASLTTAEIDAELIKADTFQPPLAHWIIATTAPVDAKLQEHARKLTDQRKMLGLCPVSVFGWGDIEALLRTHLDVTRRFYPGHFPSLAPSPKFHMPQAFHLSDYFSDPLNHLQTLRQQLLAQGETALLAKATVQGMGGVGKTQLALKYSHVFKDSYSGVWWFGAETQGGLEADCILFCKKQGILLAQNEAPGGAVRDWLADQNNWLLVYDNAEDVKMMRQFLPQTGKHHILLTSRNPHWDGMKSLPLGVWDEEQAMLFLRARLGQGIGSDDELKALSSALDGLPLALEQACAYIIITGSAVANYLSALSGQHVSLLEREDSSLCARSVMATLSLSFARLTPAAQELLNLCSWFAAEPIPMNLFTKQPERLLLALSIATRNEILWGDTLTELHSYGLCQRFMMVLKDHAGNGDEAVECLAFHRLTQAAAREMKLTGQSSAMRILSRMLLAIKGVGGGGKQSMSLLMLPDEPGEPRNWPNYKALLPHVLHLYERGANDFDENLHFEQLLYQMTAYLQSGPALHPTALLLSQRSLAIAEKVYGKNHSETGMRLNNLALLLLSMAQYDQALPYSLRSLAIAEKNHGANHSETGMRLNNLAFLFRAMGQYDLALPHSLRALAIEEQVAGKEHPRTAICLQNLAEHYRAIGLYDDALPHSLRAMAIVEKAQGAEHPNAGKCLSTLAHIYSALKQHDMALPLFKRALAIAEKSYGLEHPETGLHLGNLALHYQCTGQQTQALPLYQRALHITEKNQGLEHPATGNILGNLGALYQAIGQYDPALALMHRALAIAEKSQGSEHPETGARLHNLAHFYQAIGQSEQALLFYQRALKINESVLGPSHPHTVITKSSFDNLVSIMNQPKL